jgi:ABC-type bacteriocin/lantibiotic exporter with double-glycine peptidase domain
LNFCCWDEATGALDAVTEQRVLENLLDGSRAVLLVTHRVTAFARSRAAAALHPEAGRLVQLEG